MTGSSLQFPSVSESSLVNLSDLSCDCEREELYPTSAFLFPILEKPDSFSLVLQASPFCNHACSPSLDLFLRESIFSEGGWLKLYRQSIPLMPYMSVVVSHLPEIYGLMCSRMVFFCVIAVSHWRFIIIQGSANKPRYFFYLVIPNIRVLGLQQLLLFMVPKWVTLHFAPLKFIIFPQDRALLSVWCSLRFQLCVISVCWTLLKLLNRTDPKTDSWWTLLFVSLHSDIFSFQEEDTFHSLFTYL